MCNSITESSNDSNQQSNENRLQQALQLLLLLVPTENRILLKDILQLLHLTASYESRNKMSSESLATLFTPHLLCPRKVKYQWEHIYPKDGQILRIKKVRISKLSFIKS